MGRIGALRARWSGLSRPRRVAVIAVVVVAVGGVGAGVVAVSGPRSPAPVVWHDQVADPTTTNAAGSRTATGDGRGGGDATSNSTTDPAGPGSTVPGSTGTSQPTGSTQLPTAGGDPLAGLRVAAEGPRVGYDRDLFGDWIDADHDRCDTREEILQAQSITPPQTDYSGTACKVMAGDWVSLYDGAVLTDRTEVEIDHVVALAEAWDSGASAWDATRRHAFANDLGHPELLAVSSSTNHAKGDRDPAEWSPPRPAAQCAFASDWVAVKVAWNLSAD